MNTSATIVPFARSAIRSRSVVLSTSTRFAHRPYGYPYSTLPPTAANAQTPLDPKKNNRPIPVTEAPVYPPPKDPFEPIPARAEGVSGGARHSKLKVSVVKVLAGVMGYNSKSSTAIRETGRICGTIVKGVEKSRAFWYDGECLSCSTCSRPD